MPCSVVPNLPDLVASSGHSNAKKVLRAGILDILGTPFEALP